MGIISYAVAALSINVPEHEDEMKEYLMKGTSPKKVNLKFKLNRGAY